MSKTDGQRLYAIGDVHGELGKLQRLHDWISADVARHPGRPHQVIHLGDYVDRGRDSRGVLDFLVAGRDAGMPWRTLLGNHDRYLLKYITEPEWDDPRLSGRLHWLNPKLGGAATLRSYGIEVHDDHPREDAFRFESEAVAAVPDAHCKFLADCALSLHIGGYFFAHAGIRPGVALDAQVEQDLVWIRDEFLYHTRDHGAVIVHGHTPVDRVEHHGNRIAVDTGAVFGGPLSAIVLDDEDVGVLTATGAEPLSPMRGRRIRS
ncbi:MAG: metallophosphoesterase [Pseudomonadota bacterium]